MQSISMAATPCFQKGEHPFRGRIRIKEDACDGSLLKLFQQQDPHLNKYSCYLIASVFWKEADHQTNKPIAMNAQLPQPQNTVFQIIVTIM